MKHCVDCGEPIVPVTQSDMFPRAMIVSSYEYDQSICPRCIPSDEDDYSELDFSDKYVDRWSDITPEWDDYE